MAEEYAPIPLSEAERSALLRLRWYVRHGLIAPPDDRPIAGNIRTSEEGRPVAIVDQVSDWPVIVGWPRWAPTPGELFREAWQGADGDRVSGRTWHLASDTLILCEPWRFEIKSLCGRAVGIEPYGRQASRGGRYRTFDAFPPTDAKQCLRCTRLRPGRLLGPGRLLKPWGDEGMTAHYERMGWTRNHR